LMIMLPEHTHQKYKEFVGKKGERLAVYLVKVADDQKLIIQSTPLNHG